MQEMKFQEESKLLCRGIQEFRLDLIYILKLD